MHDECARGRGRQTRGVRAQEVINHEVAEIAGVRVPQQHMQTRVIGPHEARWYIS
jgi:hypothetical protein